MAEPKDTIRDESARAAELNALLAVAAEAIVTMDQRGDITSINPAAERLFGYSSAEVVGSPVSRLMCEPDRSRHQDYLERYLETGKARIIGTGREVEALKKSGETVPIWLSVGEAVTEERKSFVAIMRELSTERAANRDQRLLESRLGHVARFSLVGEMAAGIAHEINQPLSAISTYAQAAIRLLASGDPDMGSLAEACTAISKQAQRASQVIENLRNFIRRHEADLQMLDVNEVIRDVMPLVEADVRAAGADIAVDMAAGLPQACADAVQLQQVVLNLTRNAVDAMREMAPDRRKLRIETRQDGPRQIRVAVSDTGPGVSPRLGEAIFHPFVTTKREGLGVGLAISRTIVQSHGGTLTYKNDPEGGAIFVISLPTGPGGAE
jgi:two-component system sensor kinase FixL